MRKKIIAGNWKMNLNLKDGLNLIEELTDALSDGTGGPLVIIAPPFTHLAPLYAYVEELDDIHIAAQTCHHLKSGAYTGEVSADMVKSTGAVCVILGHSERREYNGETDELLAKKVDAALDAGLNIIFCCGESLEVRDAEGQNDFVAAQLTNGLFHIPEEAMKKVCIAYEPIWAIGTGRTASAQQAQDMHAHIRQHIAARYGQAVADDTSILYGGSCKPSNAAELFAEKDVDGGLIGGAALKAEDFLGLIFAMEAEMQHG